MLYVGMCDVGCAGCGSLCTPGCLAGLLGSSPPPPQGEAPRNAELIMSVHQSVCEHPKP